LQNEKQQTGEEQLIRHAAAASTDLLMVKQEVQLLKDRDADAGIP
jgi:hypothetical protein